MELTTIALCVAGGAMALAVIMEIVRYCRGNSECACSDPTAAGKAGVSCGAGTMAAPAKAAPAGIQRRSNRRGWRAPTGSRYHFNDEGHLYDDDSGEWILDMLIIAELCGITDYFPCVEDGYTPEEIAGYEHEAAAEVQTDEQAVQEDAPPISEPVGSETIAFFPETVKDVAPSPAPEPAAHESAPYVPPEPVAPAPSPTSDFGNNVTGSGYGGGGYGGGDYGGDSGGSDDGGGGGGGD